MIRPLNGLSSCCFLFYVQMYYYVRVSQLKVLIKSNQWFKWSSRLQLSRSGVYRPDYM